MSYHMRWCTNKDLQAIAELEAIIYGEDAYNKRELSKIYNGKNTTVLVCDNKEFDIIAYAIYQLSANKIYLLRLTVDPQFHGQGIGREMMERMKDKLRNRRTTIEIEIEDHQIVGHLFLKELGFIAENILRGNGEEADLYVFRYRLPQ